MNTTVEDKLLPSKEVIECRLFGHLILQPKTPQSIKRRVEILIKTGCSIGEIRETVLDVQQL